MLKELADHYEDAVNKTSKLGNLFADSLVQDKREKPGHRMYELSKICLKR